MVLSIADFFRRMHRREEGFTLIELLIVIAILAVLAAIAIPLVVNRIEQARISADMANVSQLQSAVDFYMLDAGDEKITDDLSTKVTATAVSGEAGFIGELIVKGYLQKPVDPPFAGEGYTLTKQATGNLKVDSTARVDGMWSAS